jgi:uncharacterized membrane protein YfhO
MKKLKNFYLKNMGYIYIFLSAITIITTVYILQSVAPFGKNSLLTIDFFHQYGPMLGELYDRINNHSSLLYSFNMGMGLPFFRNYFNYLSSPFNIILFLFTHNKLIMSYSIIIALKSIASAVTMFIFLTKKFKTKTLYFIPLALFYAYSAYFTAYYWNIMWLDGLVFLPIIILGLEKLIDDGNPLLYIISLALMLYANYFIAYMICLFCIIYFIGYLFIANGLKFKKNIKKCLLFAISSLIAGGLCAIFLIPMYKALTSISATSDAFPTSQYYEFNILEFFANHFSGVGSTVLNSGVSKAPNIACGVLCIALFFLFIINPRIKFKIKYIYINILLILVISFFWGPLDFIWHGFHVPNDLPFRYSFLYSFVFVIIAAYSLINLKHVKTKYISITYGLVMILISLLYFFHYKNINNDMILLNIATLTIYYLLFILARYFNKYKNTIYGVFIITAILEITISINNNWSILQYIEEFNADYNNIQTVDKYLKQHDNKMFRVEKTNILTFNDPSWYNYYGFTTFSSMEYENMAVLIHNLGLPGNEINSYYYKQTTPVFDLMFNIKYFIGINKDSKRYNEYYSYSNLVANKAKYNVGLMFVVNKNLIKWKYTSFDPFKIQNDFINKATGVNDIFKQINNYEKKIIYQEKGKTIVKYTIKNINDTIYFYNNSGDIDYMLIDNSLYYNNQDYNYGNVNNGVIIYNYEDYNEKRIIPVTASNKEYSIYVGYNNYYSDDVLIYTIDDNNLNLAYKVLNDNKVNIIDFKEDNINASIDAKEDKLIYTSIPYDEGWHVYIDDQEVETSKIGNALLAFNITKGKHNIQIKYRIPYIKIGATISSISLIALLFLIYKIKQKKVSTKE